MKNKPDIEAIFHQALEISDPALREKFVRNTCSGSDAQEVLALLRQNEIAEDLFPTDPTFDPLHPVLEEPPGTIIGRYKLLQKIGEGGMGVVYMAEQLEPVSRKVALKIIKLGMDTRRVVARFEAERQALALMDHPNIAKVLDGGATESGRPYFVMDLVTGIPVTKFCDQNKLPPRERLNLFSQICGAVQHAHQKGIIHRDLKPSNILVTLRDGEPLPKVIDFGIAKATNQRLTQKTLFTDYAQMIGTPAYMSPEQAAMSDGDVDTRTDVYSLGVLLYELLTGSTPFPEKELLARGYAEMQRLICEVEPLKPSTRMSTMTLAQLSIVAGDRSRRSELLRRELSGDLDWIVIKALEKDRRRRYETVNGLAMDIHRHLQNEPVIAGPPSVAYRTRKFIRRNRTAVSAGVAIAATILLGAFVATWQAIQAKRAAAEAQAMNDWVIQDFISLSDPYGAPMGGGAAHADISVRQAMLTAASTLSERFANQPEVEARIRYMIAKAGGLNADSEAMEQLRRAYALFLASVGPNDTNTLQTELWLGWCLSFNNRGRDRPTEVAEGERLMREAYERSLAHYGAGYPGTHWSALWLGQHYLNYGDVAAAEQLIPRAVRGLEKIAQAEPRFARQAQNARVMLYSLRGSQGRRGEMRQIERELIEWYEAKADATTSVEYAIPLCNLAEQDWQWDRNFSLAQSRLETALEISTRLAGHNFPTTRISALLVALHLEQNHFDQAISRQRGMLDFVDERMRAPKGGLVDGLAALSACQGDWDTAAQVYGDARRQGISAPRNLASELLLWQLTKEPADAVSVRNLLQQTLQSHQPDDLQSLVPEILLSLPLQAADLAEVIAIAEAAIENGKSEGRRSRLWTLIAARRGLWREAVQASSYAQEAMDEEILLAPFIRYQVATAHHQLGNSELARDTLERSNEQLSALLRPGVTSHHWWTDRLNVNWLNVALGLVARAAAEELILGRRVSQPITAALMAHQREAWKPFAADLAPADAAAKRLHYADASRVYREWLGTPEFDVAAALPHDRDSWIAKAAVTFLHSGDTDNYTELCRRFFETKNGSEPGFPVELLAMPPVGLPDDLREKLSAWDDAHTPASIPEPALTPEHKYLDQTRRGVVCLRLGRYEEGFKALEVAMEDTYYPRSLLATAYAAIAAYRLNDPETGKQYLKKAEDGWRLLFDTADGRLQPQWVDQAMLYLALAEARELIRKPAIKAPALTLTH